MRTPDGKDCRFYYQDFHRGRDVQECRLIKGNVDSLPWRPQYCVRCTVPMILNANSSPNMELKLTVTPVALGLGRKLVVTAHCVKHDIKIEDPMVGCQQCNAERPGLDVFWKALESTDDTESLPPPD